MKTSDVLKLARARIDRRGVLKTHIVYAAISKSPAPAPAKFKTQRIIQNLLGNNSAIHPWLDSLIQHYEKLGD